MVCSVVSVGTDTPSEAGDRYGSGVAVVTARLQSDRSTTNLSVTCPARSGRRKAAPMPHRVLS